VMIDLLKRGCEPHTGLFEELVRRQARRPIDQLIRCLRTWLLPFVLPFVDPALRDRVQRILSLMKLDGWLPDCDGEPGMRWRQTWRATGLADEFCDLTDALEAAGDAAVLRGSDAALAAENPKATAAHGAPLPPLTSELESRIVTVLVADDGVALLSFTWIAERIDSLFPRDDGESQDVRSVGKALKRVRDSGWPIETGRRGSRIPLENRHLLPRPFRD